jgi:integrase
MKASTELTHMKCEKAKPEEKAYSLSDQHGLHLLVTPAGGKLWRWKYRFDGKYKEMSFGKFPDVSLMAARKLHLDARTLLSNGSDPMAQRKTVKQKAQGAAAEEKKTDKLTFQILAYQWLDWWRTDKVHHYAIRVERWVERCILPVIGKTPAKNITRLNVIELVEGVDDRRKRETARRILQIISQIFEFGIDRCLLSDNPAAGIRPDRILSKVATKNQAYLDIKELPELLNKIRNYGGDVETRLAMEFMSLTFVRTSELLGAQWKEIDLNKKQWRIPAERMKMKTPHIVPLAKQTIALLGRLRQLAVDSEFVFPAIKGHSQTMNRTTLLDMLRQMGYNKRMTGHGWRSIASTYLHEHNFSHEIIELQLSHSKRDKVSAAYNHALYIEPRTVMMQAWADALDELRNSVENKIHAVA